MESVVKMKFGLLGNGHLDYHATTPVQVRSQKMAIRTTDSTTSAKIAESVHLPTITLPSALP